jgi:uncharacterized membrane protein YeaQ/YmgE (transglycosylase-associated protein family)
VVEYLRVSDHVGFLFWSSIMAMGVIGWIVLGLTAGYIASAMVNKSSEGFRMNIVLGIVGAVIGGWVFSAFGATGVTGFNVWSLLIAVVGAVVLLWVWHAIRCSAWHA